MEPDQSDTNGPDEIPGLSHVEGQRARMVPVGSKPVTSREALARVSLAFPPGSLARILAGEGPKGAWPAIEEVARVAGILGAKDTGRLIPMCHPLGLDHVEIVFEPDADRDRVEIRCRAACEGKTGVEMEAMTGASLAALTVYDMTKAMGPGTRIEGLELLEKRGGRRGTWKRGDPGS